MNIFSSSESYYLPTMLIGQRYFKGNLLPHLIMKAQAKVTSKQIAVSESAFL